MKALFIQDFRYMLTQKSFLVLIALVGIVLALTQNDNYIFVIGYLGFMGMITGMMSVTMDDQSNGLTFLFSLPIDRRVYVREKYIFIVLMGVSFSIFATALCLLFRMFAEYKAPLDEILATSLGTLFVMLLFVCFMLPLQLKFGAERARLASFIAIGFFFVAVLASSSISLTPCHSSRLFFPLALLPSPASPSPFSSSACASPTASACASSCAANSDKHPLTACAQSCNIMRVAKSLHACGPFEKWFNSLAPHASIHGFESRTGYALRIFPKRFFVSNYQLVFYGVPLYNR